MTYLSTGIEGCLDVRLDLRFGFPAERNWRLVSGSRFEIDTNICFNQF